MKSHDRNSPTYIAEDLLTTLFEARIAADFYSTKLDKLPYAQRFIKQLYQIERDSDALYSKLCHSGSPYRAIHSAAVDGTQPSVHDRLASIGIDVITDVVIAILSEYAATTNAAWPPKGERELPPLPCESDILEYIEPAIAAFQKTGPSHEILNELSARLQQETSKAEKPQAATANDARDRWIYNEALKGETWAAIVEKLKSKPIRWGRLAADGCRKAAKRYAERNNLSPIPQRNAGRAKKTKK